MVFYYEVQADEYVCFVVLPRRTDESLRNKNKNPSIPKLSGIVWKAVQKSASFKSFQPRLLTLQKSSEVFYIAFSLRGRRQEKKERKEHELTCPIPPSVALGCGRSLVHQTFRTYFLGRSLLRA